MTAGSYGRADGLTFRPKFTGGVDCPFPLRKWKLNPEAGRNVGIYSITAILGSGKGPKSPRRLLGLLLPFSKNA